jgi:NAD(P)-dependent dehydrogenase (short-subunit alcohol dehydrogenase family)
VDQWDGVFAVDLKGAWLMARAVLPGMIAAGTGSIVNIASLHAPLTVSGMFPYAAAKSGLVGMTRSLYLDVAGEGIRVNAVCPGNIDTPLGEEYFAQHPDPPPRTRHSRCSRWVASARRPRSPRWCVSWPRPPPLS